VDSLWEAKMLSLSRAPALSGLHPSRPKSPANIVMQVCLTARATSVYIGYIGYIHLQCSSGQCRNGIIQFELQTPKRSDERPGRGLGRTEIRHRCHSLFPHLALPHPNQLRIGMNKYQPQWPEASPEDATCRYMFTTSKQGIRKEK
jgi:hypothetical protein